MEESMHDFVVNNLRATKGKWKEVAAGSGVSKRTIEKIASGEIADPAVSRVEKLARYFRDLELS